MKFLEIQQLAFQYEQMEMHFSLEVEKGECVALLGPSGGGKSTLLNLIGGFERPIGGAIFIEGKNVSLLPPGQRPVATLFQDNNLFAHLSIEQNVGLGIKDRDTRRREQVREALHRVGLEKAAKRKPGELSGGERQRAALARSLLTHAPLLLLDEPYAALGPALRKEMLALTDQLRKERGLTVLLVTHDPADALAVAGRTAFLSNGTIIETKATPAILHSAHPAIRAYLGS